MTSNEKRFSFISLGLPGDTFGVVRFTGKEGLSRIYEFEIDLVSSDPEIDLNEVIQNPARLTILREGENVIFNGILSEFDQHHHAGDMYFYRALLVPRLWWLTQIPYNQVFLDSGIPDIMAEVLRSGGLTDDDFEIKLENNYPALEYVCQYRESHMAFLERIMEREGMYFYFEQTAHGEKVVITDTLIAHTPLNNRDPVWYSPPSGLDDGHKEEVVRQFSCRQKMVPRSVHLRDHNFGHPDVNVSGAAEVFEEGRGGMYFYGDHFTTPEEGDHLAHIRAEEYRCWNQGFFGETTIPFLRPGYTFRLSNHYRGSYNREYLVAELEHQGSQVSFMLAGLPGGLPEKENQPTYKNKVTALPADVQYRPCRKTEKPRFYGTLHARVDAAGDGKYAELDEEGRYKVILPFDLSGRRDGKASTWVPMATPYAGKDYGIHFPLHKGTEVLLVFIDGDPDRPVISAAIPSHENPSVVNSECQTQSRIITAGKNTLTFEDKDDKKRILLECPHQDTIVKLGSPVEDKSWYQKMGFDGFVDGTGTLIGAALGLKTAAIKAGLQLAGLLWGRDVGVEDGIELRTENGLKVAAFKKEEQIGSYVNPGYSENSVIGLKLEGVKGYSERSVLGWREESTIGSQNTSVVGSYTCTKAGAYTELESVGTYLKGQINKVFGSVIKAGGTFISWVGSKFKSEGTSESMMGIEMEVIGSSSELTGTDETLVGTESRLSGASSEMSGSETELSGTSTKMKGSKNEMVGNSMELSGDKTSMSGNSTTLDGTRTSLSSTDTELTGMKNIM